MNKQEEWDLREEVDETIFIPCGCDHVIIYSLYIEKLMDEMEL